MNYLEDTDRWIDELFGSIMNGTMRPEEAKVAIRERVLQSYKNGLRAKPRVKAPAPQPSPERA